MTALFLPAPAAGDRNLAWIKRLGTVGNQRIAPSPTHLSDLRAYSRAAHHSGLLRFSVNEENMMLKLMLILSSSLALASTECCR
jgi:hypothetical protein